jgi:hypothetical protein
VLADLFLSSSSLLHQPQQHNNTTMLPSRIVRAAVQARTPLIKFLGPRAALHEGTLLFFFPVN